MIEKRTGRRVDDDSVDPLIYQMVHRLASLCSIDTACPVLVYQLFEVEQPTLGGQNTADYESSLKELRRALDPERRIKVYLHTVHMKKTSDFSQTKIRLEAARAEDRPCIVRKALLGQSLFQIRGESTISV